jgi:hypothetical protein
MSRRSDSRRNGAVSRLIQSWRNGVIAQNITLSKYAWCVNGCWTVGGSPSGRVNIIKYTTAFYARACDRRYGACDTMAADGEVVGGMGYGEAE